MAWRKTGGAGKGRQRGASALTEEEYDASGVEGITILHSYRVPEIEILRDRISLSTSSGVRQF